MVLATQNPIEEEGTYVLPEAQMDRFLVKEVLTYPTPTEEISVLDGISSGSFEAPLRHAPISLEDVLLLQRLSAQVYVDASIKQYIVAIVNTTRGGRSEEHTSELQSRGHLVCRLLLEKKDESSAARSR